MLSASLFEAAFNSAPLSNSLLSPTPDAIVLAVNDAFLKVALRRREDVVGRSLFDVFPGNPDDPNDTGEAALRASLARVVETGNPDTLPLQRYPIRVASIDGMQCYEERFWNAVNVPIFDEDGALVCISHSTTEVTREVKAEAALKESQARYRSLFDSIDEGFCIIEMVFGEQDQAVDYRFIEINPMFEAQTGLRDAVGKSIRELAPGIESHWFDIYGRVAKLGEPIRFEGETKSLGRWYDAYAFRADDESMNRVAILFRDISEKRRAEEELKRSEQQALEAARRAETERRRVDALLQAVPVGIVVSDNSGAILMANAAHHVLWGEQTPEPASIEDFREWRGWWADGSNRHGHRVAPHEWTTARLLRGEEALHDLIEIESFGVLPVRRIVLNSGAPIRNASGDIIGAVVAEMDITDRVRAEESLRQADRRKDEFLAMLAHELRNPLAPIAAAAQILTLGQPDPSRVRQVSEIIARQVGHMTELVDDLLDMSRVTRGLVVLDKERLDARSIVSDAVEQVRPLIDARCHRLEMRVPPDPVLVLGDRKRLVQVMTNLLNNAAKYTPEGGDIVLEMNVDGEHVEMSVWDNGIGMAPELAARAFDLFAQGERTSDRSLGGLGIGLALVKNLVALHGGKVAAHSDGQGRGSRFTVCLPRAKAHAHRSGAPEVASAATSVRPLKVMVVDDNADAAEMLALLVEGLGHRAVVERNPWAALERARMEVPDVCLLDIGLPGMDGHELARRLRSQPETSDAVLVAVTGYGNEQERNNALASGFDHHFVKPVDTARLNGLLYAVEQASRE